MTSSWVNFTFTLWVFDMVVAIALLECEVVADGHGSEHLFFDAGKCWLITRLCEPVVMPL